MNTEPEPEAKHTTGKWTAIENIIHGRHPDGSGMTIAQTQNIHSIHTEGDYEQVCLSYEQACANAKHIADLHNACASINPEAVPKMVELLKEALDMDGCDCGVVGETCISCGIKEDIMDLLKKAKETK